MSLIDYNRPTPKLLVGKPMTGKSTRAIKELDNPIVMYANDIPIDIYSLPTEVGIIIEDVHFKPDVDSILEILRVYQGEIIITSINEKDVPKTIKIKCQLKRMKGSIGRDKIKNIAPNSEDPDNKDKEIFELTQQFLKNPDRDYVANMLKHNKPSITQLMIWVGENLPAAKIAFIDSHIKWKWSSAYLYEVLAYCHRGNQYTKMNFPSRGKYDKTNPIYRKIGLKQNEKYLLKDLLKDDAFREYAKGKLSHQQWRLLGYGEKKLRKNKEYKQTSDIDLRMWTNET